MTGWYVGAVVWLAGAVVVVLFLMGAHKNDPPTLYPVFCAWCEGEGIETIVDASLAPGSHGICERHAAEWAAEAEICQSSR